MSSPSSSQNPTSTLSTRGADLAARPDVRENADELYGRNWDYVTNPEGIVNLGTAENVCNDSDIVKRGKRCTMLIETRCSRSLWMILRRSWRRSMYVFIRLMDRVVRRERRSDSYRSSLRVSTLTTAKGRGGPLGCELPCQTFSTRKSTTPFAVQISQFHVHSDLEHQQLQPPRPYPPQKPDHPLWCHIATLNPRPHPRQPRRSRPPSRSLLRRFPLRLESACGPHTSLRSLP